MADFAPLSFQRRCRQDRLRRGDPRERQHDLGAEPGAGRLRGGSSRRRARRRTAAARFQPVDPRHRHDVRHVHHLPGSRRASSSSARTWTLQRLAVMPISRAQILGGKLLARFADRDARIRASCSRFGFLLGVRYGNDPLAILLLMVTFTLAVTALTLALTTLLHNEGQARGIGLFLTLTLAPLGGAWWPLDIVPQCMRTVGHHFAGRVGDGRLPLGDFLRRRPRHGDSCRCWCCWRWRWCSSPSACAASSSRINPLPTSHSRQRVGLR